MRKCPPSTEVVLLLASVAFLTGARPVCAKDVSASRNHRVEDFAKADCLLRENLFVT
jgi:hypothetical protein